MGEKSNDLSVCDFDRICSIPLVEAEANTSMDERDYLFVGHYFCCLYSLFINPIWMVRRKFKMLFHKNLSLLGWEEVKRRQLHRLLLVKEWIELVKVKKGEHLLDVGPGPGVFTLKYAEAIGPTGKVTALEKSHEAIEHLLQNFSRTSHNLIVKQGDAETFDLGSLGHIDVVMLTDILHHADSPEGVLRNLRKLHSTRFLISEFDPRSNGGFGPPLDKRLSEETVLEMLLCNGYTVTARGEQIFEHYYIIANT